MRARPYFRTRFRVRVSNEPEGGHWQGGPTTQRGADCPVCKKRLLLIWDINAQDPAVLGWNKNRFGGLKRLPLFYCWGCVGDLSYRIESDDRIRVLGSTGRANGGAEYDGYPECFPRRPVELTAQVPAEVKASIRKWGPDGLEPTRKFKDADYGVLADYFGHRIVWAMDMIHHQFGGRPLTATWDDEAFVCPNTKCSGGLMDRVLRKPRTMKFLAGVLNDPPHGLPMIEPLDAETAKQWNTTVSIQFHMCNACYAITAANRCT